MLKCQTSQSVISIRGNDRMQLGMFAVYVSFAAVIVGVAVWLITRNMWFGLVAMIIIPFSLTFLKSLLQFQIVVTRNTMSAYKSFMGFRYASISHTFDKVLINEQIKLLTFQGVGSKVEIEQHEGFELDALLISSGNRTFEFGDKDESANMFDAIRVGLGQMEIEILPSDTLSKP